MSICAACEKFPLELFTKSYSINCFDLHPSLTSLLASASAGCKFCVFLQRRLGIDSDNVLPQPSRIMLFGGYRSDEMTYQIDEPDPWDVERPRHLHGGFHFAVEPFEGTRRPITGDTRSEETFRQIEKWLGECDVGHIKCRPASDEEFLPTRLVDLQSIPTSSDASPKLILAADLPSKHVNYIALSYARSSNVSQDSNLQARMTTQENVNEHLSSGMPYSKLPLTIREGIDIAQRLKIRYIWDHSLCIIQDSPSDWTVQSPLIPKNYAHAYVTVAASASANIHEGYFRDSAKTTEQDSVLFSVSSLGPSISRVVGKNLPNAQEGKKKAQVLVMQTQLNWGFIFNASPLNKHIWAAQEREFSSRILHFTETQVLWECRTLRASEGLPESNVQHDEWPKFPPRLLDGLHEIDEIANGPVKANMWLETVKYFSSRSLERAEDKFPALASLAQNFASHTSDEYVAGFWKQDLLRSLSWACLTVGTSARVTNRRHETFVAPTWSWASVDGPVDISYVHKIDYSVFSSPDSGAREAVKLMPKILGVHLPRVTPSDPFGPLKAGAELRLKGYMIPAALGYDGSYDGSTLGYDSGGLGKIISLRKAGSSAYQQGASNADFVGTLYFDVPSERAALDPKEEVFVLYVHPWYRDGRVDRYTDGGERFCGVGIALVRTGMREGREREREYKRVGHVRPLSVSVQHFEGVYKRVGHVKPLRVQCFEGVREEEIVLK